ncbi:MAG: FKBP-type peptidyl-prolyl cis-trans isomerase [Candidatus Margulisiibacteriota bacterium]|jgi:FKBP-type peptidyl-prolyl cis-trans isomerase
MNRWTGIFLVTILFVSLSTMGCQKEGRAVLKDNKEKVSYSIGQSIGVNIKNQKMDLNLKAVIKGLEDGVNGKSALTPEEMQKVLMEFQKEMQTKQMESFKADSEKNLKEGDAFLEKNKKESGVITLPSGLQYKVIKSGNGVSPKATDTVVVHYIGKLLDGKEFDNSYKRNQPATFKVNQIIPGWSEALQNMKVGDKWTIFLPSNLAYGANGAGPTIGPNAVLIFEVELLDVNPPVEAEKK